MIDKGFFQSRQFVVAGIVALLIMAGGAASVAYSGFGGTFSGASNGCRPREVAGSPLDALFATHTTQGGRHKDQEHTLADVDNLVLVDACLAVGELLVTPSEDGSVQVLVRVRSDAEGATNATTVEVRFTRTAEGTRLALWQPRVGRSTGPFGDHGSAHTTVEVRVPDSPSLSFRLENHVGDVRLSDLTLGHVTARVDVGDVRILRTNAAAGIEARVDVGSAIVDLASVQSGTLDLKVEVGELELRLPTRADVGYDVVASSDVGNVQVSVGETEHYRETSDRPGMKVEARTRGFSSLPTQVRVLAASDVGSVLVKT